ncbi:hypothetical protein WMF45_23160 [Sorangium sp. So ce448]|uniref:hypothetical protein n=1 Tax=Sorangium sp. So ce448 TaxID=3133314 RepID=UPI003F618324
MLYATAILFGIGCRRSEQPDVAGVMSSRPEAGRTISPSETSTMTSNQKYLDEAQAHMKEFDAQLEPERLREAYMALENVSLSAERDPATRSLVRASCLSSWLRLLQVVDHFLDPKFDVNDVPFLLVQPPPTSTGVVYPPGADPALIDDPVARAQYENAVAANREKLEKYRMQVQLHRVSERLTPRAEAFIRDSYTSDPSDQAELRAAIDQLITNPARKAVLSKLLSPLMP